MNHEDFKVLRLLEEISIRLGYVVHLEGKILTKEDEILALLKTRPILTKASIDLMPKTIEVGQTANAVINAVDQFGNPFPLTGLAVQYVASIPGDVTFGPVNPDGSDTITGVNADAGNAISANITRADGTVITAAPDTLTITPAVPVLTSATVVLS
jgi:hypothetical protein